MAKREPGKQPGNGRGWHASKVDDAIVFAVCQAFLNSADQSKKGVASAVAEQIRRQYGDASVTRERVYPLLCEGVRRGMIVLCPPVEEELAQQIADRYKVASYRSDRDTIRVANVRGPEAHATVCAAAAELVRKLMDRLKKRGRDPVHVGLGAGASAMMVAKQLARRIRSDLTCPRLVIHALSSGGFTGEHATRDAPVTYFGLFDDALVDVQYVGLYCPTVSSSADYPKLLETLGIREAFEQRHEIDIVVTSFAKASDPHGLLARFLRSSGDKSHFEVLEKAGFVGEIQFRPFSPTGPIVLEESLRAVTLFEISELRELAATPDKHVVLLSAPCLACGQTRTEALRYLMRVPELHAWTNLVTDVQTAKDLLLQASSPVA